MKAAGIKGVFVLGLIVLISGCASMSESECQMADWRAIGFEDGAMGRSSSRIGEHRSACADHGVAPDHSAYKEGYAEGVREYCTPAEGFARGKRGAAYTGFCPNDLRDAFVAGYKLGKKHYQIKKEIDGHRAKINSSNSRISQLEKKVREKEAELIDSDTEKERRSALLQKIKGYQKQIGELEATIIEHEKLKAVKESDYSKLEQPGY